MNNQTVIKKALMSIMNKLGVRGKYKGRDVLFCLSQADEVVGVGFANTHLQTCVLKIMISDIPDLKAHDVIELDDRTYKIISEPKKDIHGLIWECEAMCD